jgi:hypothetical protein
MLYSPVVYYRLVSTDRNGSHSKSNTVQVHFGKRAADPIKIYPNPFASRLTLEIYADRDETALINLYDITGKIVFDRNTVLGAGSNTVYLDALSGLKPGLYFVSVTINGETFTNKITKE